MRRGRGGIDRKDVGGEGEGERGRRGSNIKVDENGLERRRYRADREGGSIKIDIGTEFGESSTSSRSITFFFIIII